MGSHRGPIGVRHGSDPGNPGDVYVVRDADVGSRLDRFLAAASRLGSRSRAADAVAKGKVFVNDAEANPTSSGRALAAGDCVRVWMDRPGTAKRRSPRPIRDTDL